MHKFRYLGSDYELEEGGGFRVWYGQHYLESFRTAEEVRQFIIEDAKERIDVLKGFLNKIENGEIVI